jgi:hypothetical protein
VEPEMGQSRGARLTSSSSLGSRSLVREPLRLGFESSPCYASVMLRRIAACLVILVSASACFAPASPTMRVSDAAHDLNVATRFGKMELALSHVDGPMRKDFTARRSQWGRDVRIIDVDLASVEVRDETHAVVVVDISWVPLRDDILRTTRVTQSWEDAGKGWKLTREVRTAGDHGLFGEILDVAETPHPDVHLPSRTLKSTSTPE